MTGQAVFVGIDVAKATLDLAVRPLGERWTVANEEAAIPEVVAALTCGGGAEVQRAKDGIHR